MCIRDRPGSGKAPVISETRKTVIKSAIDTRNQQEVDVEEAVRRGILDLNAGTYTDMKTNKTMSIQDAIDCGLLKQEVSLKQSADYVTTKAIRETRSFTITGAIDPRTGQEISVAEAMEGGVIDQANGQYVGVDNYGNEMRMPISEAIKRGLPVSLVLSLIHI